MLTTEREREDEIEVVTGWGSFIDADDNVNCRKESLKESSVISWNPERRKPAERPHDAFVIRNIFSNQECKELLERAETHGFGKTNYPPHYRGNLRLITTDQTLTDAIFNRIAPLLPQQVKESRSDWNLSGLNEKWRLAKYYPGHRFGAHVDAYYKRSQYEKSMYTVNIYMNEGYEGGHTRFYSRGRERGGRGPGGSAPEYSEVVDFEVIPETGMAILFRQPPHSDILHDGDIVVSGLKYLFRTDVIYRIY